MPFSIRKAHSADSSIKSAESLAAFPEELAPVVRIKYHFYHKASATSVLKSGLTKQGQT